MSEYALPDTLVMSVLGILAVFFVLAMLMFFIKLITLGYKKATNKKQTDTPAVTEENLRLATGSCGNVKLFNVPDRDAAMIMAVVADELKTPLNELRFISIKETEV